MLRTKPMQYLICLKSKVMIEAQRREKLNEYAIWQFYSYLFCLWWDEKSKKD